MNTITVKMFVAECGRRYSKKSYCLEHEKVCKCWKNPKYKTCLTCKFDSVINESDGSGISWKERHCTNEKFDYDVHFRRAHENAKDLCFMCTLWENKKC